MKKVTYNKGNWSGEENTVLIDDDGNFELHGCKFKAVRKIESDEDYTAEFYEILSEDHDNDVIITVFNMGKYWVAQSQIVDLSRDDVDPMIAALQVLHNTL